jgi:exosortase K
MDGASPPRAGADVMRRRSRRDATSAQPSAFAPTLPSIEARVARRGRDVAPGARPEPQRRAGDAPSSTNGERAARRAAPIGRHFIGGLRDSVLGDRAPAAARWLAAGLLLMAALLLKRGYSHAGSEQLLWVLGPSCWLAQHLGVPLVRELGAGFISHSPRMVVGPACAGVNFLVVCWLALYFSQQGRCSSARGWFGLAAVSGAAAYLATLATNGLRIALAAQLLAADLHGWLSPERAHRVLGVVLYCAALLGLCRLADGVGARLQLKAAGLRVPPLAIYLAVALGVPLLRGAYAVHPALFAEHALFTLAAAALVALAFGAFERRR